MHFKVDLLVHNTSSALRNFAVELGKISNDIRLMASGPVAGFGELEIPAVHAGSSIMPGKGKSISCRMYEHDLL